MKTQMIDKGHEMYTDSIEVWNSIQQEELLNLLKKSHDMYIVGSVVSILALIIITYSAYIIINILREKNGLQ